MRVSELLQNPKPFIGKEVTVTGIVHRFKNNAGKWDWYFADYVLQSLDAPLDQRLSIKWSPFLPEKASHAERTQARDELKRLIWANVSIGAKHTYKTYRYKMLSKWIEKTIHYGSVLYHLDTMSYDGLRCMFEDSDDSWKTIKDPFFNDEFESSALELYEKLNQSPLASYSIPYHRTRLATARDNPYQCESEGHVTGIFNHSDNGFEINNAWKLVVSVKPLQSVDVFTIAHKRHSFFDNFGGKSGISLKKILLNPEKYYHQQVTIIGLFTHDSIVFGNDIEYARVVPNRLYYEYRAKQDYRVSLYIKRSKTTEILFSFYEGPVPGEHTATALNRSTSKIRITGTIYPPEHEHSSIVLENITELVVLYQSRIYHIKPPALKVGSDALLPEYIWRIRQKIDQDSTNKEL